MNEQEWANRLSADVERLSQGECVTPTSDNDYDTLVEVAKHLTQANFSADSTLRETLRNQLLDRIVGQREGKIVNQKPNMGRKLALESVIQIRASKRANQLPPLDMEHLPALLPQI